MDKLTYGQITKALRAIDQRITAMETFLLGCVELAGREDVLTAAAEAQEREQAKVAKMLEEQIKSGIDEGWLKPSKVSNLDSVLTGTDQRPGAKPTAMQVIPKALLPPVRGPYIGRTVGEEFEIADDSGPMKVKITGVYEVDNARREQVIAEHQSKLAEKLAADKEALAKIEAEKVAPSTEAPTPAKPPRKKK